MLNNDTTKSLPMPDDYESDEYKPRNSEDSTSNGHGTQFLKLVMHNQLIILNGRTLGDSKGKYTSIQKQGCSVVDYFAVTRHIFPLVNYLKVQKLTEYSDHKPLSIELRCKTTITNPRQTLESQYQSAPSRFIFNEENKNSFIDYLAGDTSKQTIHNLNNNIYKLLEN